VRSAEFMRVLKPTGGFVLNTTRRGLCWLEAPGRRARDHRPLPQPALPSNTGEETGITRIWRARRVTRKGTPTVANLMDAFTHPTEYRARVEAEIAAK
jgi:hypothetical protein